ncbi:MAG: DUF397 domain-containing protein [Acidimicrobiales bacterium]
MASVSGAKGRTTGGWFKSSFSNGSQLCVEVRFVGETTVQIRDSKWCPTPGAERQPVVTVSRAEWRRFLDGFRVVTAAA